MFLWKYLSLASPSPHGVVENLPAFPNEVFKRCFIFHITVYVSVIFLGRGGEYKDKHYPFALNIFGNVKVVLNNL